MAGARAADDVVTAGLEAQFASWIDSYASIPASGIPFAVIEGGRLHEASTAK